MSERGQYRRGEHPVSLANLQRGGGRPAQPGDQRRLVHGGRSELLVRNVEAEVRELMDALGDAAPVRDPDGSLPVADLVAVERTARLLKRYRHLDQWLDLHGVLDERTGDVKPAAELAARTGESLARALDQLGMTPTSRAKLGLDLARTHDVALQWSQRTEQETLDG